MRKLKIIILFFAIFVAFGMCVFAIAAAYAPRTTSKLSEKIREESEWNVGAMDLIVNNTENYAIDNLPVYSYELITHCVGSRFFPRELSKYVNHVGYTINWFNDVAELKIDNIQKYDDDHIAVIYRTTQDGYGEAYVLVVFERNIDKENNKELWEKTGEAYFIDEVRSYDDYKHLKVGDSIEKLYEIDKSIVFDVQRKELSFRYVEQGTIDVNLIDSLEENVPKMIYKLVLDGIVAIEYDDEKGIILDILFYSNSSKEIPYGVTALYSNLIAIFILSNTQ